MFKSIFTFSIFFSITLGLFSSISSKAQDQQKNQIVLSNTKVSWAFDKNDGALISFKDLDIKQEFLVSKIQDASIWEFNFTKSSNKRSLTNIDAEKFEFTLVSKDILKLEWKSFKDPAYKNLQVLVTVNLNKEGSAFWNISLTGIADTEIEKVIFPKISGLKDMTDEYLVSPNWMGELVKNPRRQLSGNRKYELYYPGHLSMQFMALYGKSAKGFYVAANDTQSFRKDFAFQSQNDGSLSYQLTQFLPLDKNIDSYTPSYAVEIASFSGDWISAAEKYKSWGAQQYWAKESRLKNGLTPDWLTKTALWVWNRGESQNVLEPSIDLKNQLGLPVSVLWHWWHNGSYDDSFPDYIPPREGEKQFIDAVKKAKDNDVQAIVYMNSIKWGNNMPSYYKENAEPYTVKEQNGEPKSFVYNIFTKKALTYMCMTTPFWKEKYGRVADTVLRKYGVGGIYMDQACLSALCYDPSHDHPIGGGNYWVPNFNRLTKQIRERTERKEPYILAGEGGGESWLPTLDAFLTLQVSNERYSGISEKYTIPLFQAVYHEYGITFGNYSSLLYPPYDELWPAKYALKKTNEPLDKSFNKQFLMEQARSFVWGMQPAIANYQSLLKTERKVEIEYLLSLSRLRNKALKYLLYGSFARPPKMTVPQEEIAISKLSIYAGQDEKVTAFKKSYPMIYSGAWKSTDGSLAITLASIQDQSYHCVFSLKATDYGLKNNGKIYLLNEKERIEIGNYTRGKINIDMQLAAMSLAIIEIIPGHS